MFIMSLQSKKTHLLILGVASLACSRSFFALIDDPEGPNLLIVVVLALAIYLVSIATYVYLPVKPDSPKKLLLSLCVQVIFVAGLYFCLW